MSDLSELERLEREAGHGSEVADVLRRAADYMVVNGKSNFGVGSTCKCAMMTIYHVGDRHYRAEDYFRKYCQQRGYEDISDFNRQHEASYVVAGLRDAAALAEQQV